MKMNDREISLLHAKNKSLVYVSRQDDDTYKVYYYNNVYLGDILVCEDGYYYYWPEQRSGFWHAEGMKAIAEVLDNLNREWDKKVRNEDD
jgi:hypothetical protein